MLDGGSWEVEAHLAIFLGAMKESADVIEIGGIHIQTSESNIYRGLT